MHEIPLTAVEGIAVGNEQDLEAATGCTVILCEKGATGGVDVRGGAPGTRETDLLNPLNLVEQVHAVLLTGGSAFGLDAAAGIMQFLEERNIGFNVGVTTVPIVCGAVLFDLAIGDHRIRPDREMGYRACLHAVGDSPPQGNFGAGAGATVGKILGMGRAMKSGLGVYALQAGNLKIGALAAVNCLGDVLDPETGERLAGPLNDGRDGVLSTEDIMAGVLDAQAKPEAGGNTTLGCIVTNARFTKAQANRIASMAQDGIARTMRPSHSMFDGDTIFTMATG
ncbi:MAG: P1 family peptidase, partial [Deltaproteobacteria bacterium]|nr:P1 family peptidase [Deltaproteobacteria bacterium]